MEEKTKKMEIIKARTLKELIEKLLEKNIGKVEIIVDTGRSFFKASIEEIKENEIRGTTWPECIVKDSGLKKVREFLEKSQLPPSKIEKAIKKAEKYREEINKAYI